jgi:ComF family protein
MLRVIKEYSKDLYRLFFPKICGGCDTPLSKGEDHLCLHCRVELPYTHFEMLKDNPVEKVFHGRISIQFATSMLFFSKGEKVQNILHNIKYNEQKELAVHMGRLFGARLQNNPEMKSVTTLVPVPLHPRKLHLRGYNQSDLFAEGMKDILGIELQIDNLHRVTNTATQTNRTRAERWENVENVFAVKNASKLRDKHVLLIDDVLTTGATLESCALALMDARCTVSVATIACVL